MGFMPTVAWYVNHWWYTTTKNHKSDVCRLQKFEEAIMAADGKSNLAVIHNNLIEYEENAHKSSEKLDEVKPVFFVFFLIFH